MGERDPLPEVLSEVRPSILLFWPEQLLSVPLPRHLPPPTPWAVGMSWSFCLTPGSSAVPGVQTRPRASWTSVPGAGPALPARRRPPGLSISGQPQLGKS